MANVRYLVRAPHLNEPAMLTIVRREGDPRITRRLASFPNSA